MKTWYSIKAAATPADPTEVLIYGDIGMFGVNAASFIDSVKMVQGPIRVRINSGGGDVFDGLAMFNFLSARGNVETIIDGIAASAATLPFLAGSKRTIPKNAFFMIHNPWTGTVGKASDMRKAADLLDRIGQGLADVYSRVTGMVANEVQKLMDAETWLNGQAAKDGGWATDVVDLGPVKASVQRGRYSKVPSEILAAAEITTAPESARASFRKGIQQVDDGLAGDGLEPATVKEARSLASGELPTEAKIRKANAWWGRNERFLDAEAGSPADVAANLWGGASGRDWFKSMFNSLDMQASIKAAAPGELIADDYVSLTFQEAETKGQVASVLMTGTATGSDGSVEALESDPAAIVTILEEVDGSGQFTETEIQVARLFSTLTRIEPPTIVEQDAGEGMDATNARIKISAPVKGAVKTKPTMKTTAKLLSLLGVQMPTEDTFLASAIADLGVTPEAVTKARKDGTTDFLATHITDRIAQSDAKAKAASDRASEVLASIGVPDDATDIKAAIDKAIADKAAAKAAEIIAAKGFNPKALASITAANAGPQLSGMALAFAANRARHAAKSNN